MHRVVVSEEHDGRTSGGTNNDVRTDGRVDEFGNEISFSTNEVGNGPRNCRDTLNVARGRLDAHQHRDIRDGRIERLGCRNEKLVHVERIG
jgi:hypothetical protein